MIRGKRRGEEPMELFLDLERTPTFLSCDYVVGEGREQVLSGVPDEDRILFLVRGTLSANRYTLPAGQYYLLRAGDGTRFVGKETEYFIVSFHGTFVPSGQASQTIPLSGRFDYKAILRYWNRLLEFRDKRLDGQTVSIIEQQGLFCLILGVLYSFSTSPAGDYLAQAIMTDIAEHYTSDITLEELSRNYFYSVNYIIRVFKKKYQVTPYQHIIHMRIEKAKQLLCSSDRSCQEIAESVGYRDMSSFYKAFLSEAGESPDRWRRRVTEQTGDYRKSHHAIRDGE